MKISLSVYAGLLVAMLLLPPNAVADLITYEMSGTASGNIGGTAFNNALVDMVGTGDTASVSSFLVSIQGNPPVTVFANPFENFTVTIAGVGTATVTDQSTLWAIPAGGDVLFGREDHVGGVPVLNSITGIGLITNLPTGYEGTTAIGPTTESGAIGFPACGGAGQDPCIQTTLGALSFSSNIHFSSTTETTFAASLAPVPEPSFYWALVSLLLGLGAGSRALKPGKSDS